MIVDNSNKKFGGESTRAMMEVHRSFVELTDQIFESTKKVLGQEAILISNGKFQFIFQNSTAYISK